MKNEFQKFESFFHLFIAREKQFETSNKKSKQEMRKVVLISHITRINECDSS